MLWERIKENKEYSVASVVILIVVAVSASLGIWQLLFPGLVALLFTVYKVFRD